MTFKDVFTGLPCFKICYLSLGITNYDNYKEYDDDVDNDKDDNADYIKLINGIDENNFIFINHNDDDVKNVFSSLFSHHYSTI